MAGRKLVVEIVGDDRDFQRAMNTSTKSATRFGGAIDKVNKRAGAATGFFGRGGGALLGGAAITAALRSAVLAAQEQEVVLGQTQQVVKAAGLSWETYADRVEAASDRISVASAFDDEDVLRSFQVLIRGSGDVEEALGRVELATDVARGRYIELEQATQIVNKAALGQVGALRRLGIQIDTNATSTEALALLQEKFGGSAATFAESSAASTERLAVALENLKESLGTLLLPLVAELAQHLTDAAVAADKLVKGLSRLADVRVPKIKVPIVGEIGGGKTGDLLKTALGLLNPKDILIPVRIVRIIRRRGDDDKDSPENTIKGIGAALSTSLDAVTKGFKKIDRAATGGNGFNDFVAALNNVISTTTTAIAKAEAHAKALERLQRVADIAALAVAQVSLVLDRASATPTLRDDIAGYEAIGAALAAQERAIRAQLALKKDDIGLQNELVSVQSQQIANENSLAAAVAQRAQNQKDAARQAIKDAAELAAKQREAEKTARQAAQFRALGLQATGEDLVPTADNLRRRLGNITDAVKGTFLDTNKTRSLLQRIRRVFAGEFGKITKETRELLDTIFDGLEDKLGSSGPLTKTSGLNSKKIADALGLDPAKSSELRSLLSGFNTAGRALAGATASTFRPGAALGAGAGIGGMVVESHVTLQVNEDVLAKVVTRGQQKTRRRNPQQKRGPNRIGA